MLRERMGMSSRVKQTNATIHPAGLGSRILPLSFIIIPPLLRVLDECSGFTLDDFATYMTEQDAFGLQKNEKNFTKR